VPPQQRSPEDGDIAHLDHMALVGQRMETIPTLFG